MNKISAQVKTGLANSPHKPLRFCEVRVVFKGANRLKHCLSFKDIVPDPLQSCQICNSSTEAATFPMLLKPLRP